MILDLLAKSRTPLDLILSRYFRSHKSIGAHDRRKIGEILYTFIRHKTLIDHFCPAQRADEQLAFLKNFSLDEHLNNPSIPEPARLGLSDFLMEKFCSIFGLTKTKELAKILNQNAPTTIRANALKTSRESLLKHWEGKFELFPCEFAPYGIQFRKREPLFALPEFKQGLFEMQDEGSQLIASLVEIEPKDHFLDYCSGSGGKTLAIAPSMQGKGQIYLNDNRPQALQEARKRLRRAGVQNAQFVLPRKKVDWILLDVPCSGSGSLRRNPDAKWKIDSSMIERLIKEQREILKVALPYLKSGGKLVYATCSIFPEENESQVAHFLSAHPLTLEKEPQMFFPKENGMDGFFAAVFKKQSLL